MLVWSTRETIYSSRVTLSIKAVAVYCLTRSILQLPLVLQVVMMTITRDKSEKRRFTSHDTKQKSSCFCGADPRVLTVSFCLGP